jgi:hypothetical protein
MVRNTERSLVEREMISNIHKQATKEMRSDKISIGIITSPPPKQLISIIAIKKLGRLASFALSFF